MSDERKYKKLFVVGLIAVLIALIGFSLASTSLQQPPTVCTTGTFLQTFGNGTTVCNTVPLQGTLSYFFTNQTSVNTESPSKRMLASPDSNTTVIIDYPNVADNLTFQNFTTRQGLPNISLIPGGEFHIHIHANTDKSNFVMIYAEVVEVNNTGHPIAIIGTTEHEILSEIVETQLDLHFFRNETYFMNSTSSRIQVQFYAHVIQDTPGITLYFDGPTSAGLSLPSVTVDASNFVPYTGATQDVDLGTHNISAANLNTSFNSKLNSSGDTSTGLQTFNAGINATNGSINANGNLLTGLTPRFTSWTQNPGTSANLISEFTINNLGTTGTIAPNTLAYIQYDLGSIKRIIAQELEHYSTGNVTNIQMQGSQDNVSFTLFGYATSCVGNQCDAFGTSNVRYIRFYTLANASGTTIDQMGLRVYNI